MKVFFLFFIIISHFAAAQNARFLIPYREGKKWGYCDTLGKVVIAPKYYYADFFESNNEAKNSVARVVINDSTFMFIDSLGAAVTPLFNKKTYVKIVFVKDKIYFETYNSTDFKKGLYCNKKQILQNLYREIYTTYNNNFIVEQNGKFGMFDEKGNVLIPVQYDNIRLSYYQTTNEKICWNCYKGKTKIKFEQNVDDFFNVETYKQNYKREKFSDYEEISKMNAEQEEQRKREETINLNNPKAAEKNNEIAKPEKQKTLADTIYFLRDSLKKALELDTVEARWVKKFFYVEKVDKQGFIDDSLKLFFMEKKYNINEYGFNNRASWLFNNYQSLAFFSYKKNGKYGLSNEFDDTILAPIYDLIDINMKEGIITYTKNNKTGLFVVNTFYKNIKPKYDFIKQSQNNFKVNSKWSFSLYEVYKKTKKNNEWNGGEFLGFVGENGIEYFKN